MFYKQKVYLINKYLVKLFSIIAIIQQNFFIANSQLSGSEKTMEQFLDKLLHESVYDRRIRPFYTDSKSESNSNIYVK